MQNSLLGSNLSRLGNHILKSRQQQSQLVTGYYIIAIAILQVENEQGGSTQLHFFKSLLESRKGVCLQVVQLYVCRNLIEHALSFYRWKRGSRLLEAGRRRHAVTRHGQSNGRMPHG